MFSSASSTLISVISTTGLHFINHGICTLIGDPKFLQAPILTFSLPCLLFKELLAVDIFQLAFEQPYWVVDFEVPTIGAHSLESFSC